MHSWFIQKKQDFRIDFLKKIWEKKKKNGKKNSEIPNIKYDDHLIHALECTFPLIY